MRAIAFVDLDDTLFQTRRKCPPEIAHDRLTPIGFARDGAPIGFATPRQMQFLGWLAETTRLIPVTARSLEALRRVRIPYVAAICAHGGVILDEGGEIDRAWAARIAAQAQGHAEQLLDFAAAIEATARARSIAVAARVLSEEETALYVVAKHDAGDAAALAAVVAAAVPALPPGWRRHINGNNAALLPSFLDKAHAVAALLPGLRARFPDAPLIGVGDSFGDAPFIGLCDYALLPIRSQLAGRLFGDA